MKKYTKGFTLIELLVVIAIIGILSSVVLASLSTAKNKGGDAAIKSQLNSLRAQAALYLDTSTSSAGLFTDTNVQKIAAGVLSNGGLVVFATTTASADWAASSKLISTSTQFFCVDSAGNAMATTANVTSGGAVKCN